MDNGSVPRLINDSCGRPTVEALDAGMDNGSVPRLIKDSCGQSTIDSKPEHVYVRPRRLSRVGLPKESDSMQPTSGQLGSLDEPKTRHLTSGQTRPLDDPKTTQHASGQVRPLGNVMSRSLASGQTRPLDKPRSRSLSKSQTRPLDELKTRQLASGHPRPSREPKTGQVASGPLFDSRQLGIKIGGNHKDVAPGASHWFSVGNCNSLVTDSVSPQRSEIEAIPSTSTGIEQKLATSLTNVSLSSEEQYTSWLRDQFGNDVQEFSTEWKFDNMPRANQDQEKLMDVNTGNDDGDKTPDSNTSDPFAVGENTDHDLFNRVVRYCGYRSQSVNKGNLNPAEDSSDSSDTENNEGKMKRMIRLFNESFIRKPEKSAKKRSRKKTKSQAKFKMGFEVEPGKDQSSEFHGGFNVTPGKKKRRKPKHIENSGYKSGASKRNRSKPRRKAQQSLYPLLEQGALFEYTRESNETYSHKKKKQRRRHTTGKSKYSEPSEHLNKTFKEKRSKSKKHTGHMARAIFEPPLNDHFEYRQGMEHSVSGQRKKYQRRHHKKSSHRHNHFKNGIQ